MSLFEEAARSVLAHPVALTLLVSFVFGEEAIIFLSFLAGQGLISLWLVMILGFFGLFLFDNLLLFILTSRLGKKMGKDYLRKKIDLMPFVKKIGKDKPLLLLMASKFVYGTRIFSLFYVEAHGLKHRKCTLYDSIALLVWIVIMSTLGWLAGRGFAALLHLATRVERYLGIALLAFLVIYLLERLISYKFIKKI